ncbi:unnamed protein product [Thlaspi arvense]|uniref:Endoglucanase n=1 Tax=Thlaspi arvense TaxID=13288 RepID=A0AAU9S5X2_THLAR|nr:unnamed protein product [Thlaspi arvense]
MERKVDEKTIMGSTKSFPYFGATDIIVELDPIYEDSLLEHYGEALTKSLLYFEAQRSGALPSNQRVNWRGDSALRDGSDAHIDLTGGYYDAGDNMKFGFPLAFTTTMLAWSNVEMASQLKAHGEAENALAALKWATDYLIKAHPEPNVLYGQVGDGNSDHACWMRPEDMTTPRPSYRIDAQHPGADLAGETAAAMAAASLAFAPSDAAYAQTLIDHAKDLFEFGKDHPGVYHNSIPNAAGFYPSSGHEDELLWAAAWLHRATGDQTYLDYLTQASNTGGSRTVFAWDDKFLGAQVLAAKLVFEGKVKNEGKMAEHKSMAEQFICNCAQKGYNNVKKTPGGLLWFLPWDNLQYTASASFVLSTYSKYLKAAQASVQCPNGVLQASDLLDLARAQVDYILGSNPKNMSYMVGFGTNYPNRPHHRGASIVSIKKDPKPIICNEGFAWYSNPEPNPNVLVGAIVGGPDDNDAYQDERSDFQHAEPDTATVAPLVDYGDALTKTLLYFEAQRSGKLPSNQRVSWRGDSALRDGSDVHLDLTGGYYDSGDNMKFGFPLAFTATMLAWSSVEMSSQLKAHHEYDHALAALKWVTDYLIKAHPEPNVLYGQVGDGNSDHACWMRPEDMTTPRPSYRIDAQHPGADLAGETAAAMAAASLAFAPTDAAYAKTLIGHAKDLFEFAKAHPGVYQSSISNAGGFYASSGYEDELLWAAAWLHRATNDQTYLDYVTKASNTGGSRTVFAWDDKFVGVQVLMAKLALEGKVKNDGKIAEYKSMAESFICNCAQKGSNNVKKTPGGLLWFLPWNNLQYTVSASFVLSAYSKYLNDTNASIKCPNGALEASDLVNLARAQVDYILGSNPKRMSYMVGFGTNYPTRPHHRGASIVSIKKSNALVECSQGFSEWFHNPAPNPNVIVGGVVGGPDENDAYGDDRTDYQKAEPAPVTVAPLVGLLAAIA